MTTSKNLEIYTEYRNLSPMKRLEIYQVVKSTNPNVKSLTKLDRLCVEYFKTNIYGK